jgi:hypothetical protein
MNETKQMKMFTCPVFGWTAKSPGGENDIMEHAMLHSKNHHSDWMSQSGSAETVKKMIKDK